VPRKFFFHKYLPDREAVRATWLGRTFGTWLRHPSLWHLSRRSVPGAVAIGLFCGLVPGPLQMLSALLFCLLWKKNLPISLALTLYTNPFTIVPLYLLAYWIGTLLLGMEHVAPKLAELSWHMNWQAIAGLGKPLAVGVPALALTLAVTGYLVATLAWRCYVIARWKNR